MARSFQDVLAEVTAQSDPQRQTVLKQIADLPTQQAADEAGLEAKKTQAFDEILGGARRRGLGFSGIPVGEQAKYTATDYAPALANLKAGYGARRGTLESALSDIGRSDYMNAQDIFARDRAFEEQQRQFDAQQAAYSGLFNQTPPQQTTSPAPAADPYANINKQNANNAIHALLNTGNAGLIRQTIDAITKSANAGNAYDKYKLELLQAISAGNSNAAFDPTYAKLLRDAANYKPTPPSKAQSAAKGASLGTYAPLLIPGLGPLGGALLGGLGGYLRR